MLVSSVQFSERGSELRCTWSVVLFFLERGEVTGRTPTTPYVQTVQVDVMIHFTGVDTQFHCSLFYQSVHTHGAGGILPWVCAFWQDPYCRAMFVLEGSGGLGEMFPVLLEVSDYSHLVFR